MSFTIENEKKNKMDFLDVKIVCEENKFTKNLPLVVFVDILAAFYRLPITFGTVYKLAWRCFRIFSSWNKLHIGFVCLKEISLKNDHLEHFINNCFKRFLNKIHVVKETDLTVEKNSIVLVLPYLGSISLQTRTKLNKSSRSIFNYCKLQIVFKIRPD